MKKWKVGAVVGALVSRLLFFNSFFVNGQILVSSG